MTSGKVTGKIINVTLGSLNHVLGEVDTSNQAVPSCEKSTIPSLFLARHLCVDRRGHSSSSLLCSAGMLYPHGIQVVSINIGMTRGTIGGNFFI